ncbi:hypothetical protein [Flavobacterium stagni]|uniref:VWA domain-containing protein n=1 Tax=Flavobacterium stagni TaxID=2506421 RepID=A0A4Q1K9D1_9FLAO|nr:hypothetical protein [Flavobacterium stagni]RXR22948.1 hypothetical protein EQG61_06870 [Flavobacterium stagni]
MTINTVLLLILALTVASGLSFFHYYYKARSTGKITRVLAFLRFLSIFGILVLLINPIVSRSTYETNKPPLALVVDNSASIADLKADKTAKEVYGKLVENDQLQEKFEVQSYAFDADFRPISNSNDLNFKGKASQLDKVGSNVNAIHKNLPYTTVLLSDGNQTSGSDFVFGFQADHKVFPLIVGDTTQYMDLRIAQVNVNKYAFHKNQFPVEVFLNYTGTQPMNAVFSIQSGNSILVKENVQFSADKRAQIVNALLPANAVGLQIYTATISSKSSEKNTYNNSKKFAVEIIDQKTEVALISDMPHPDLGAIKRSIESNAQRKVTVLKPNQISDLGKYNVLILYQPNARFKSVFETNKNLGLNTFIITGNATDFGLLNQYQTLVDCNMSNQKENYLAQFNSDFNVFAVENIGFENFPPLENPFGNVALKDGTSVLLESRVQGIETGEPLWVFSDQKGKRGALLLGENIWKWRAHSYVEQKSFEKFDQFLDKTIQFLASNDGRKSLIVNHERFYNSGDNIEITAQYFNKNYELDEKARLTISLTNTQTKQRKQYDLVRSSNSFKVNLDGLTPGKYAFNVKELNSNSTYSGSFEVLDFDIEKQFVNADVTKLKQLANHTQGTAYVPNQVDVLIKKLVADPAYKTIQKEVVKKSALIDWKLLLLIITGLFAAEWFIRKYNGML